MQFHAVKIQTAYSQSSVFCHQNNIQILHRHDPDAQRNTCASVISISFCVKSHNTRFFFYNTVQVNLWFSSIYCCKCMSLRLYELSSPFYSQKVHRPFLGVPHPNSPQLSMHLKTCSCTSYFRFTS